MVYDPRAEAILLFSPQRTDHFQRFLDVDGACMQLPEPGAAGRWALAAVCLTLV